MATPAGVSTTRLMRLSVEEASRATKPAFTNRSTMATMVAPSTPSRSANSDCDKGDSAFAAMAIVIQLAWLTPKYFKRRSTACFHEREVLCKASLKRSSMDTLALRIVRYLSKIAWFHAADKPRKFREPS